MTTITPEQFMAAPNTDEDDDFDDYFDAGPSVDDLNDLVLDEPLVSIALSLSQLVTLTANRDAAAMGQQFTAVLDSTDDQELMLLVEAHADLESKHRALFGLLADVEKIVKPSTSKLANAVRDAITAWRNPGVPGVASEHNPLENSEPGPLENSEPTPVPENLPVPSAAEPGNSQEALALPAADAPVEAWRDYARSAYAVPGDVPVVIDSLNRSQIRTLLGLPHFDEPTA
jgi:hypothetical protein